MFRKNSRNGMTVVTLTVALGLLGGAAVHAQEQQRPDDQSRHEDQGHRDDQGRNQDQGRHDDNDHGRHDEGGGGDADRYRKDHPHAAARCHDGFFTNTSDRARACTKHGGIDVWLRG